MSEWAEVKQKVLQRWEERLHRTDVWPNGKPYVELIIEDTIAAMLEALKAKGIGFPPDWRSDCEDEEPCLVRLLEGFGKLGVLVFIPETGQKGDKGDNDTQQEKTPS